jgi:hypothetical protein
MCGKPGKGRHGTSHHAKVKHISNIKSFLPVKGVISITKVWTDGQTDGRTDGLTDGRTRWLQYSPLSTSGGITIVFWKAPKIKHTKIKHPHFDRKRQNILIYGIRRVRVVYFAVLASIISTIIYFNLYILYIKHLVWFGL